MKKLVLILMVLVYSAGYSQPWINLDLPDLTGVTNGETVIIPITATDVIMPNELSSFYIYVEWDDAVLDYVDAALSPEMAANIGPLAFIFLTHSIESFCTALLWLSIILCTLSLGAYFFRRANAFFSSICGG